MARNDARDADDAAKDDRLEDETRRRLCQLGLVTLAGVAVGGCGSGGHGGDQPDLGGCGAGAVALGSLAKLGVGQAMKVPAGSTNVFVCRDANGLYALDAGCTHLGCDVELVDAKSGFLCRCHGSTFDFNGLDLAGPAHDLQRGPLKHYALCVLGSGTLVVDPETNTDAATRLKVG